MVRIYRGTQTGVYTHFVDLPILYDWNNILTDFGNDIGGYYWNLLSSPINKEDLLSNNNPCNQIEINNISIKAYMGTKPVNTKGVWKKGDRVYNNFVGSEHGLGWIYNGNDFIEM